MDLDACRDELLDAILTHVPFDGWTRTAMRRGAEDIGLSPADADLVFPRGPAEVVQAFSNRADTAMLRALEGMNLAEMRVQDRVKAGVRLRIEGVAKYREAVRRGLIFFTQPQQVPDGVASLCRTVDAIWYAAGDRSTDYNYYTKRFLLSGVFSSTLLYWLNDKSEDSEATWAFLDRRIAEVLKIGGTLGKTVGRVLDLPDRLFAAAAGRRAAGRR